MSEKENEKIKAHRETEHNRTQFQIDRIAFFSDAVIAIALTLMVLEIKMPELGKDITLQQILDRFGWSMVLHTIALFVGFSTIGNLWIRHHQLFEHIINYNHRMMRINLYFLFSLMLLPISIQFLFASNEPIHYQLIFYFSNLFFSSFTYGLLVREIYHKKNNFSSIQSKQKIFKVKEDSYLQCIVFFVATVLLCFHLSWFYVAFFIFPAYRAFFRIREKYSAGKNRIEKQRQKEVRHNSGQTMDEITEG
jgi:uncharacterized membrane protein